MALRTARAINRIVHDLQGLVNLQRYPIPASAASSAGLALGSAEPPRCVQDARQQLARNGIVTFPDFLTESAVSEAAEEILSKARYAFTANHQHTAYLSLPHADPNYNSQHIRNRLIGRTYSGFTAYSELEPLGALRRVYESDSMLFFIAAVLGRLGGFYRLADPLGACSVNIYHQGMRSDWHFDESEFTVTLCLQDAEEGGVFEITKPLRTSAEDLASEEVEQYVSGKRQAEHQFPMKPGTLAIFGGRSSLHRVTEVKGERARLAAVLCFAAKRGQFNSAEVQKKFFGRVQTPYSLRSEEVD